MGGLQIITLGNKPNYGSAHREIHKLACYIYIPNITNKIWEKYETHFWAIPHIQIYVSGHTLIEWYYRNLRVLVMQTVIIINVNVPEVEWSIHFSITVKKSYFV